MGWNCNLMLAGKFDRPNINFRVIIYQRKKHNSDLLADSTYEDMMRAYSSNCILDDVNTDACRVLKEFRHKRPAASTILATAKSEYTRAFKFFLPAPQKHYQFDATSTSHQNPKIFVAVLCYDHYGSLSTDNIAYAQFNCEMLYKDA